MQFIFNLVLTTLGERGGDRIRSGGVKLVVERVEECLPLLLIAGHVRGIVKVVLMALNRIDLILKYRARGCVIEFLKVILQMSERTSPLSLGGIKSIEFRQIFIDVIQFTKARDGGCVVLVELIVDLVNPRIRGTRAVRRGVVIREERMTVRIGLGEFCVPLERLANEGGLLSGRIQGGSGSDVGGGSHDVIGSGGQDVIGSGGYDATSSGGQDVIGSGGQDVIGSGDYDATGSGGHDVIGHDVIGGGSNEATGGHRRARSGSGNDTKRHSVPGACLVVFGGAKDPVVIYT